MLILSSSLFLILGLVNTHTFLDHLLETRFGIDFAYTMAFTVQLLFNLLGFGPQQFWKQGWMRFDGRRRIWSGRPIRGK